MVERCFDCGQLLGFLGLVGTCASCDECGAKLCKKCVKFDAEKNKWYCEKCWRRRNIGFWGKIFSG